MKKFHSFAIVIALLAIGAAITSNEPLYSVLTMAAIGCAFLGMFIEK